MERFKWETRPKALECNIVSGEKYRFSILTDRLIRMEYSPLGVFEDRASQMAFYRDFASVDFSCEKENENVIITTKDLRITYKENEPFSKETLEIELLNFGRVYHFGDEEDQLFGTCRTLDGADGKRALYQGVCAKNGAVLLNDTERLVLTDDGWFDIRKNGGVDYYFFGYGHDYLDAVRDLYRLTGAPPLLPSYALGNWWSRYHKYTQEEYLTLMDKFKQKDIPFSVSVVDMDWHITQIPEDVKAKDDDPWFSTGWTGYTFNRELFPDHKQFFKELHKRNLVTALNLHPAHGVGAHEEMYEEMAVACGIDPKTKKRVKLDCLNPKFMENYFDILHHPYEKDGVDFWWMDWQQGVNYKWIHDEDHPPQELEKMDPLWLLNHLHIIDIKRNGKRPMFFSRYSGAGSHRYPIGFSGDTSITWDSLDFQPYFTSTASNIGYSWWSHDIGGHHFGYRDDELTVRWMQLGVFSPINRLHSTSNDFASKEPWNLNPYACQIACDLLRFRHKLFPYLYTMNLRNHEELIPLVQPIYYQYPEREEAYEIKNQYFFGSELMVSPITEKTDPVSLMAKTKVWIPKGLWFDFFRGDVYSEDKVYTVYRTLHEMPVFAKAGAIVPLYQEYSNKLKPVEDLQVIVFAGADNTFTLYEDSGDGYEYQNGEFLKTVMNFVWGEQPRFELSPIKNDFDVGVEKRNWTITFRGFDENVKFEVLLDETPIKPHSITYNKLTNSHDVCVKNVSVLSCLVIKINGEELIHQNPTKKDRIFDIILHSQIETELKQEIYNFITSNEEIDLHNQFSDEKIQSVLGAIDEQLNLP